ncbi:MAG TPA: iron-containing redox enzyme family protein [Fimbriimonadaceae bacterium]|nr:iron-containing redox enzyme family protein [Fimbriimonadaceae bacterium]
MDIKQELDAVVAKYDLLKHPFYEAWNAGTLPTEALATYAEEYGAFVQTVPAGWAAHGDPRTASEEVMHAVLWERFANALGTTSINPPKIKQTKSLVDTCTHLYKDPVTALGGLYAFEAQQPHTSTSKLQGLRTHYSTLPKAVEPYFEVHCDDVHEMAWIVDRLEGKSDDEKARAVAACQEVAKGLWDALTGIHDQHCAVN